LPPRYVRFRTVRAYVRSPLRALHRATRLCDCTKARWVYRIVHSATGSFCRTAARFCVHMTCFMDKVAPRLDARCVWLPHLNTGCLFTRVHFTVHAHAVHLDAHCACGSLRMTPRFTDGLRYAALPRRTSFPTGAVPPLHQHAQLPFTTRAGDARLHTRFIAFTGSHTLHPADSLCRIRRTVYSPMGLHTASYRVAALTTRTHFTPVHCIPFYVWDIPRSLCRCWVLRTERVADVYTHWVYALRFLTTFTQDFNHTRLRFHHYAHSCALVPVHYVYRATLLPLHFTTTLTHFTVPFPLLFTRIYWFSCSTVALHWLRLVFGLTLSSLDLLRTTARSGLVAMHVSRAFSLRTCVYARLHFLRWTFVSFLPRSAPGLVRSVLVNTVSFTLCCIFARCVFHCTFFTLHTQFGTPLQVTSPRSFGLGSLLHTYTWFSPATCHVYHLFIAHTSFSYLTAVPSRTTAPVYCHIPFHAYTLFLFSGLLHTLTTACCLVFCTPARGYISFCTPPLHTAFYYTFTLPFTPFGTVDTFALRTFTLPGWFSVYLPLHTFHLVCMPLCRTFLFSCTGLRTGSVLPLVLRFARLLPRFVRSRSPFTHPLRCHTCRSRSFSRTHCTRTTTHRFAHFTYSHLRVVPTARFPRLPPHAHILRYTFGLRISYPTVPTYRILFSVWFVHIHTATTFSFLVCLVRAPTTFLLHLHYGSRRCLHAVHAGPTGWTYLYAAHLLYAGSLRFAFRRTPGSTHYAHTACAVCAFCVCSQVHAWFTFLPAFRLPPHCLLLSGHLSFTVFMPTRLQVLVTPPLFLVYAMPLRCTFCRMYTFSPWFVHYSHFSFLLFARPVGCVTSHTGWFCSLISFCYVWFLHRFFWLRLPPTPVSSRTPRLGFTVPWVTDTYTHRTPHHTLRNTLRFGLHALPPHVCHLNTRHQFVELYTFAVCGFYRTHAILVSFLRLHFLRHTTRYWLVYGCFYTLYVRVGSTHVSPFPFAFVLRFGLLVLPRLHRRATRHTAPHRTHLLTTPPVHLHAANAFRMVYRYAFTTTPRAVYATGSAVTTVHTHSAYTVSPHVSGFPSLHLTFTTPVTYTFTHTRSRPVALRTTNFLCHLPHLTTWFRYRACGPPLVCLHTTFSRFAYRFTLRFTSQVASYHHIPHRTCRFTPTCHAAVRFFTTSYTPVTPDHHTFWFAHRAPGLRCAICLCPRHCRDNLPHMPVRFLGSHRFPTHTRHTTRLRSSRFAWFARTCLATAFTFPTRFTHVSAPPSTLPLYLVSKPRCHTRTCHPFTTPHHTARDDTFKTFLALGLSHTLRLHWFSVWRSVHARRHWFGRVSPAPGTLRFTCHTHCTPRLYHTFTTFLPRSSGSGSFCLRLLDFADLRYLGTHTHHLPSTVHQFAGCVYTPRTLPAFLHTHLPSFCARCTYQFRTHGRSHHCYHALAAPVSVTFLPPHSCLVSGRYAAAVAALLDTLPNWFRVTRYAGSRVLVHRAARDTCLATLLSPPRTLRMYTFTGRTISFRHAPPPCGFCLAAARACYARAISAFRCTAR